jgi:hypothetical protein
MTRILPLALLFTLACPTSSRWSEAGRAEFTYSCMDRCVKDGGGTEKCSRSCTCALERIQPLYTEEQMEAVGNLIASGQMSPPQKMLEAFGSCAGTP